VTSREKQTHTTHVPEVTEVGLDGMGYEVEAVRKLLLPCRGVQAEIAGTSSCHIPDTAYENGEVTVFSQGECRSTSDLVLGGREAACEAAGLRTGSRRSISADRWSTSRGSSHTREGLENRKEIELGSFLVVHGIPTLYLYYVLRSNDIIVGSCELSDFRVKSTTRVRGSGRPALTRRLDLYEN